MRKLAALLLVLMMTATSALAEKLGIPYYDKQLLAEAAKDSGICEELFEDHDEKPTRSLLFSMVMGMKSLRRELLRTNRSGAYSS